MTSLQGKLFHVRAAATGNAQSLYIIQRKQSEMNNNLYYPSETKTEQRTALNVIEHKLY